ncbi:hypothetical protein K1T71_014013 [Dendrolimus kikuchii]|uniref:Uncharacterized protein n=1 Tax=Dendrolimus kikuchii TaxID=765133 RepID=A0ACC1CGD6_9NEOP|nr:hypothetical protein K1T71_014013 [Dendrolimus kikuchii]
MLGGAGSPGGDEFLTVTVVRDEHGYGMKVSGDNPVYVQSVKEHGAAWRAGLRAGDRILRVDSVPVHHHTHQQVVHMIRANPTTVLTVQQNTSRHKTPITAPVPVNSEKQRQLEVSKVTTIRLMLEKEQLYIRNLRNELSKVPDVRKQADLESAEQRCSLLQHEIDNIMAGQPPDAVPISPVTPIPTTPRLNTRTRTNLDKPVGSPLPNTGFLSGLPRSLSNLTGQSLRNLRQARQNSKNQQENQPPLVRQNSDESNNKRRHVHNNTVPMVPTTCLDNVTPPPLPPRSIERPKRNPLSPTLTPSPPVNPLAKPKPCNSASPAHKQYYKGRYYPEKPHYPMHQSVPQYKDDNANKFRRSSHSLDGELDGPQPNSIAMQMSYPLVNAPPPPLQTDNRTGLPVVHMRSRSSPEQFDHDFSRSGLCGSGMSLAPPPPSAPAPMAPLVSCDWAPRHTPPPGTPPPPYATNTQPCADPQRAIISMEEDDSPASDTSTYSGLFSNLRSVRESKARMAVLLNWLLAERRCACASLLLVITDGYRSASGVATPALRRWAYEIQSTFLMPNAILRLNGVDENMANEIEHILVNEYEKEELLRNVFRKARQKAKEELGHQLSEFQVKRQVGLATLYGPDDAVLEKCDVDKAQELVVVEQLMCAQLRNLSRAEFGGCGESAPSAEAHTTLMAALIAAALCLHCRPASVAAAVGGTRGSFLQRDKLYKQRVKQITKQHPQPYVVRGHHLQLQALTSVGHCHRCEHTIGGLAPQAFFCSDCKLRVHRLCAKDVEEGCCMDGEHHNNRISRFMERIHQPNSQDSTDKKSRKTSSTTHFLNMERSVRKAEEEQPWDATLTSAVTQGDSRREGSTDDQVAPDPDVDTSDANPKEPEKESNWRTPAPGGRGVNRAESCRERDAPRRGKHRNASDPNRLTAHNNHDLEPGAATAPSGSSSSSSLSSRSNESNTVAAEQQASQSDWSEEDEALTTQWCESVPRHVLDALTLNARLRKRQEVIHELIVSEGSHVRWLKVLGKVFLRPLESQPTLLPPDELRALFPNLPGVRERHSRLYADLRALRNDPASPLVQIRPVADAMLTTLGDSGYASCLSRFCRGQRMALEALRERRRKNKELHQFLVSREQLPLCGRLQLRDLLACVWQRLTKYQLLLEGVLKTVCDSDVESEEDVSLLRRALDVAKDVLHGVDTAIRTAENEHRLKTIQSKLEIRVPAGSDWEELRRLDLAQHSLRMEGDLTIRNDSKKVSVLALMLEDSLVLMQREGDKFVLKPISQPSHNQQLSPLIKWDKVLFRPNAAVRNTFFLMNINGVQMHELSANTAPEYATWVKYIQESPLAKLTELKLNNITPSHQASRSTDDSGINVSRNPSDASEKSNSAAPAEEQIECEKHRTSAERSSVEREREREDAEREKTSEREDRRSTDKEGEVAEREEKHKPRRPTVGRISTHGAEPAPVLEPSAALTVHEPAAALAHTAHRAYTHQERLRRLDEVIRCALRAKSAIVAEVLGVPPQSYAQVADLAVAEALGQVDVEQELRSARGQLARSESVDDDSEPAEPDMHQLLLAAQTQANQLTSYVRRALTVNEAGVVAARARGHCDTCRRRPDRREHHDVPEALDKSEDELPSNACEVSKANESVSSERALEKDVSFDMLAELDVTNKEDSAAEDSAEDCLESNASAAELASRLVGVSCGLQRTLARLLAVLPTPRGERALREQVAVLREANDALRAKARTDYYKSTELLFAKEDMDTSIQDQPSNGG